MYQLCFVQTVDGLGQRVDAPMSTRYLPLPSDRPRYAGTVPWRCTG